MKNMTIKERMEHVLAAYQDDPFRRMQELNKLLKAAENSKDVYTIGYINYYLSICIFEQGRRGSMLAYAYKAVSLFETMTDPAALARGYNLMGIAYAGQGNYQAAIGSYRKALDVVAGKKKSIVRKETLLNNIGDSYFKMGVYSKSLRIALNCLSGCRKKDPENHRAIVLYGINGADCLWSMGKYTQAKELLDGVEANASCLPDSIMLCGFYVRRACVLYGCGDVDGGARNTDLLLELVRAHYDTYEFHHVFEKIVSFQISYGDFERAQRVADALTNYAKENGHTLDKIMSKRVQAKIYYATGESEQALALFKELNVLYDVWMNDQKVMQYESQKSVLAAGKEIAKLMQKMRLSEEKAERDPLTGLMNRSALVSVTDTFLRSARENGSTLGGIFFDIDFFKGYNDTYGHAEGDEVIKLIAKLCLAEENEAVKFFRYGGDEYFGIVLGYGDGALEKLALRISETVRNSGVAHVKNPNGGHLTVSIGIVNVDMKDSKDNVLDLIKYADKALYHAKDYGKDCVFAYSLLPNGEHEYRHI